MKVPGRILLSTAPMLLFGCHSGIQDQTRGVSEICEVHRSHMSQTNVTIQYGLVRLNDWGKALQSVSSTNFPHAPEEILGGCVVGSGSPTKAIVFVCPECRQARQRWTLEHPAPVP
jgi:hypothetical protein